MVGEWGLDGAYLVTAQSSDSVLMSRHYQSARKSCDNSIALAFVHCRLCKFCAVVESEHERNAKDVVTIRFRHR